MFSLRLLLLSIVGLLLTPLINGAKFSLNNHPGKNDPGCLLEFDVSDICGGANRCNEPSSGFNSVQLGLTGKRENNCQDSLPDLQDLSKNGIPRPIAKNRFSLNDRCPGFITTNIQGTGVRVTYSAVDHSCSVGCTIPAVNDGAYCEFTE